MLSIAELFFFFFFIECLVVDSYARWVVITVVYAVISYLEEVCIRLSHVEWACWFRNSL